MQSGSSASSSAASASSGSPSERTLSEDPASVVSSSPHAPSSSPPPSRPSASSRLVSPSEQGEVEAEASCISQSDRCSTSSSSPVDGASAHAEEASSEAAVSEGGTPRSVERCANPTAADSSDLDDSSGNESCEQEGKQSFNTPVGATPAASAIQVAFEKFEPMSFGTLEEHARSHDFPVHVATCGACKFWKNRGTWSETFSHCHPVSGKRETWLACKNGFGVCLVCAEFATKKKTANMPVGSAIFCGRMTSLSTPAVGSIRKHFRSCRGDLAKTWHMSVVSHRQRGKSRTPPVPS